VEKGETMSTLPKFQEPDWSTLPKEAVAWAVDEDGEAWAHTAVPRMDEGDNFWFANLHDHLVGVFDLTNIDWRTTLRLRPTEPAKVEPKGPAEMASLMEVRGCGYGEESQRSYELERLAEEAWKSLLVSDGGYVDVAGEAFELAAAFIAEREKRRNK